jgi:hypothetical protein
MNGATRAACPSPNAAALDLPWTAFAGARYAGGGTRIMGR